MTLLRPPLRPSVWLLALGSSGCYLFKSAEIESTCEDLPEGCDGGGDDGVTPDDSGDSGDGGGDSGDSGTTEPPTDADGDGFPAEVDCDDTNPAVHPEADETCATAGVDDDCDGLVDDDDDSLVDGTTYFLDADGDGYGLDDRSTYACAAPSDYASRDGDCDDSEARVNPGESEVCDNALDDDCDGTAAPCSWSGEVSRTTVEGRWLSPGGVGFATTFHMGDLDADGRDEAALGVPSDGDTGQGTVYVVGRPPLTTVGALATVSDAVITGTEDYQGLGALTRILPDVTGDGIADLGISDWSGQLFLMDGPVASGSIARPHTLLEGDVPTDGTGLLATDISGDAQAELIVGLPFAYDPSTSDYTGALAIYQGPVVGGTLDTLADADIVLYGPSEDAAFGYALDHADFDGDGLDEVVVAAPAWSTGTTQDGIVAIYDLAGTTDWSDAEHTIVGATDSVFGYEVIARDFDDDGTPDLLVSAPTEPISATSVGAVYWFDTLASGTSDYTAATTRITSTEYAYVGYSLTAGDSDGDGVPGFAMGAPYHSSDDMGVVVGFHTPPRGSVDLTAADYWIPSTSGASGYGADVHLAPVAPSSPAGLFVHSESDAMIEYFQGSGY